MTTRSRDPYAASSRPLAEVTPHRCSATHKMHCALEVAVACERALAERSTVSVE